MVVRMLLEMRIFFPSALFIDRQTICFFSFVKYYWLMLFEITPDTFTTILNAHCTETMLLSQNCHGATN